MNHPEIFWWGAEYKSKTLIFSQLTIVCTDWQWFCRISGRNLFPALTGDVRGWNWGFLHAKRMLCYWATSCPLKSVDFKVSSVNLAYSDATAQFYCTAQEEAGCTVLLPLLLKLTWNRDLWDTAECCCSLGRGRKRFAERCSELFWPLMFIHYSGSSWFL